MKLSEENKEEQEQPFNLADLFKLFVPFWMLFFSILLVMWQKIPQNTTNFFDCLLSSNKHFKDYEPDYLTAGIVLFTLFCGVINIIESLKKNQELKKEKQAHKNAIKQIDRIAHLISIINPHLFIKAKDYYDAVYPLFRKLERHDTEFSKGCFDNISLIEKSLDAVSEKFRTAIRDVFGVKESSGVNIMFFFDINKDKDVIDRLFQKSLENKSILGHKPENDHLLRGVLYLPEVLNIPLIKAQRGYELLMPIYSYAPDIPNICDESTTLPGAPRAFFDGYSVIKNTRHIGSYPGVNDTLANAAIGYFENNINVAKTLSVISYRISDHPDGEEMDCIAILNIESFHIGAFSEEDSLQNAFYAFVLPTFKEASKCLKYYKEYIKSTC